MFVRVIGTKILWEKVDFHDYNIFAVNRYICTFFGFLLPKS